MTLCHAMSVSRERPARSYMNVVDSTVRQTFFTYLITSHLILSSRLADRQILKVETTASRNRWATEMQKEMDRHYRNGWVCRRHFAVGTGSFVIGIACADGRRRRMAPQAQGLLPSAQSKAVGIGYADGKAVGVDSVGILFSKINFSKKNNFFLLFFQIICSNFFFPNFDFQLFFSNFEFPTQPHT